MTEEVSDGKSPNYYQHNQHQRNS